VFEEVNDLVSSLLAVMYDDVVTFLGGVLSSFHNTVLSVYCRVIAEAIGSLGPSSV
jgi:hypothetical protein